MTAAGTLRDTLIVRFRLWARHVRLERKLALALIALSVIAGIATVATMTGTQATMGSDARMVIMLLYVDLVLLLALGLVVARRLVALWVERRRGMAGSQLHIRFVLLFGILATAPAVLVAVFSALFLNFGVQTWFSERVSTAVKESYAVAQAYLHEHRQTIRADAFAVANDLNMEAATLTARPDIFARMLSSHADARGLSEALVMDGSGQVMARSALSFSLEFDLAPQSAMEQARKGKVVVLTNDQENRVRALVKLNRFVDAYLLVGRLVEASVLNHIDRAAGAIEQYKRLEKQRKSFQISFVMIFLVVTLLLLLAAVWIGLSVATQLTRPISRLITASERVTKGETGVRVKATASSDEIGSLGRAFNRMTSEIEAQHEGLMEANRELDERRRFTETVLAGVSAGVIGLDTERQVQISNRSAGDLLGIDLETAVGKNLAQVAPEMTDVLNDLVVRPERAHTTEITRPADGHTQTLIVNMAAERLGEQVVGYVVTFDDVTELLSAQRKAAWADVARRIAHEIKNPLTPIQLSAERLKRKYLKEITSDPDTFVTCTETIVRQVGDIGRMVDEFSSFARMPQARLKTENLSGICREIVSLERNRISDIAYDLILPEANLQMGCDSRQIAQALTNVLKNAAESIVGREDDGDRPEGRITLRLSETANEGERTLTIAVEDNGRGLPTGERNRLTEPYVSTRTKGTGLGLAIVKKIMEDHNGDLVLEDRPEGGARVIMTFHPVDEGEEAEEAPDPMSVATQVLT